MKKVLLLSMAASAVIFAGGDIQPVEPAAPASADFWGQIGFRYQATDDDATGFDWGDDENNEFSVTAVLGVEKELDYGFGFGVELAGWTDFDLGIADNPGVDQEVAGKVYGRAADQTGGEISQAYITYKYCNTAIKAGRQALPKAVSPWAWSDRSAGVIDLSYDGIVIANTDLEDTTLVGAWVKNVYGSANSGTYNISDSGVFALGIINKSIADTTISVTGYYVPENMADIHYLLGGSVNGTEENTWSVWASVVSNVGDWTVGVQGAYVDGDYNNIDATYAVAAKLGTDWLCGDLHTDFVGWYINDGEYSLKTAGSTLGTSAFWGNSFGGEFNGDVASVVNGYSRTGGRVDFTYKLWGGKLFGGVGYEDFDGSLPSDVDNQVGGRIGYSTKIMGLDTTVQYRYLDVSAVNSAFDRTRQKIRVEAYYKF
jgi:hypothetical protein